MPSTVEMINCVLFTHGPTQSNETEGAMYVQGDYLNTISTTPQTCQRLLVAREACSWVKVQSLLTLPQGPVTLWLNLAGLLKSF